MKIRNILIVLLVCCCCFSCKKKPVVPPPPAPVVKEAPAPAPVVEEKKPIRNKVQNHFLIAGCFEYKSNADKLANKLQKEGYDPKIIPYFENLYLVSYDGFPTKQEALSALKEFQQDKKETVWVYSPKK